MSEKRGKVIPTGNRTGLVSKSVGMFSSDSSAVVSFGYFRHGRDKRKALDQLAEQIGEEMAEQFGWKKEP
jgi:hypothetical protein